MVKGGEFVGGAVLGAGFGVVGDLVRETIEKSIDFNPSLENLQYTQKSLRPCVDQIEALNISLGYPDEEIEHLKATMRKGDALDNKFKDVSAWNLGRPFYTEELVELEESRHKQLEILNVQGIRDAKENLVLARESNTDVKNIVTWTAQTSDKLIEVASCGKENLVLARDHTKQLGECKTRVDEFGAWTGKTTHQLDQVVSLGSDTNKQIAEFKTAWDQEFELRRLVKNDKEMEAVVEQAALGKSVEALSGAVDKASLSTPSGIRERLERGRELIKAILRWMGLPETWGIPPEDLKAFRIKIDKGVEMVLKCSQVTDWTSAKTVKYTNKILGVEKILQELAALLSTTEGLKSTQKSIT